MNQINNVALLTSVSETVGPDCGRRNKSCTQTFASDDGFSQRCFALFTVHVLSALHLFQFNSATGVTKQPHRNMSQGWWDGIPSTHKMDDVPPKSGTHRAPLPVIPYTTTHQVVGGTFGRRGVLLRTGDDKISLMVEPNEYFDHVRAETRTKYIAAAITKSKKDHTHKYNYTSCKI